MARMNVLNICRWDFGGCAIRLTDAINQHTKHVARHLSTNTQSFGYKRDIFTGNVKEINNWINWADIVNCWGSTRPIIYTKGKIKKLIITYVGSHFRSKPHARHLQAESLGAKRELGAAPWMCNLGGINLEWLPIAVPVVVWAKYKKRGGEISIVCQSPSSRRVKQTNRIMNVLKGCKGFKLVIVEGLPWSECMKRKGMADICLGQFYRGYGVSALESWSMGIPVITDTKPNEEAVLKHVGYLPYYKSTIEDLPKAIKSLLGDGGLYKKYSDLGIKYVREFHDYPVVANRFVKICESIL